MTDLTPDRLDELVRTYEDEEPFYLVERQRLENLPPAVRDGSLLWKDAQWIVRWYYRRHLDRELTGERERVESAFRSNPWDAVRAAIETAAETRGLPERITHLTDLDGIAVPEATAILHFVDPGRDMVMGPREWRGLRACHELDRPYPETPVVSDYATFLRTCRSLGDRLDADLVSIRRALWRLGDPDTG